MLLGLVLGFCMVAAGSQGAGALRIEGAALCDCVGGDQASNQDAPGQPPPRLLDGELEEDSEDDKDDDRNEYAHVDPALAQLLGQAVGCAAFGERRNATAERTRAGHGARGPPRA